MLAVKSGDVHSKHNVPEVGQIKLESGSLKVWGQQRNSMRGELEHGDNVSSLLKTVLVVVLLHWKQYFVAGVKAKMRERKRKEGKKKGGDS